MIRRILKFLHEEYATALTNFLADSSSSSYPSTPYSIPPTPALCPETPSSFFPECGDPFASAGRPSGTGSLGSMFDLLGHKATPLIIGNSPSSFATPLSGFPPPSTPSSPLRGASPVPSQVLARPSLALRTPSVISPHVTTMLEEEFSRKSHTLKPVFIEAIQELMDEVEMTYRSVGEQSIDHIHSG